MPLLTGPLRAPAIARLREIAEALDRPYGEWSLARPGDDRGLRSVSLALGRCGVAVFYAWLDRAGLDERAAERASRFLGEAIDLLPSQSMDATFFCGFPGVAWTTEHVLRVLGQTPAEDPNADVDDALLAGLADPTFVPAYDVIDGLAGHGAYALERRERATGVPLASAVLARLEETACPQRVGLSWPSGAITRTAQGKNVSQDETYFNLGLSHGVPGVIGILARFVAVPSCARARCPCSRASSSGCRTSACPPAPAAPTPITPRGTPRPGRHAWRGATAIRASLPRSSPPATRPSSRARGVRARRGARGRPPRPRRDRRRRRGALPRQRRSCAHLPPAPSSQRRRRVPGRGARVARAAARARLGSPERGRLPHVLLLERLREGEYIEDPAWLTGAAGVGLVLISALTDPLPTWDRALLLDLDA